MAKVSVSGASSAGAAARSAATTASQAAARNAATGGAAASGGFSSALNAASDRSDGARDNHSGTASNASSNSHAASAAGANARATSQSAAAQPSRASQVQPGRSQSAAPQARQKSGVAQSGATRSGATASQAASAGSQGQNVDDDAAEAAASDTCALGSTLASQDAPPAEQNGKSRGGGDVADDGTMDPTTLALLLASNGAPVTALTGSDSQTAGNQNNDNDSNTQRSAGATAAAAAAGALAASLALASVTASGNGSSPQTGNSGAASAVGDATAAPAAPTDPSLLAALNNLQVGASDAAAGAAVLGTDSTSASSPSAGQPAAVPTGATAFHTIANGMQGVTTAAAQTTAVERSINIPMTDRNWSGEVAGQVQWMVNNNIQSATLQLSPDHLGPVEIHIDVQASQVNVTFSAAHPDTRSALEQTVPQLRSLMASGGLTLGQTSVQQQQTRSGSSYGGTSASSVHASSKSVESVTFSHSRGLGLIDEYA